MERKHAIIVIKNENGEYLQYFDEVWNSYLFPNCKITNEQDIESIKNDIYIKYNINIENIDFVMDKVHLKFSEKDKIIKEYHHYFYKANIDESIDVKNKFKYFSYDELINDKRIQEVNSDIVSYIKEIK